MGAMCICGRVCVCMCVRACFGNARLERRREKKRRERKVGTRDGAIAQNVRLCRFERLSLFLRPSTPLVKSGADYVHRCARYSQGKRGEEARRKREREEEAKRRREKESYTCSLQLSLSCVPFCWSTVCVCRMEAMLNKGEEREKEREREEGGRDGGIHLACHASLLSFSCRLLSPHTHTHAHTYTHAYTHTHTHAYTRSPHTIHTLADTCTLFGRTRFAPSLPLLLCDVQPVLFSKAWTSAGVRVDCVTPIAKVKTAD